SWPRSPAGSGGAAPGFALAAAVLTDEACGATAAQWGVSTDARHDCPRHGHAIAKGRDRSVQPDACRGLEFPPAAYGADSTVEAATDPAGTFRRGSHGAVGAGQSASGGPVLSRHLPLYTRGH